jgi:CDP-glycerol glycerophosphotransferase (TagB/SpsB family)
MIWLIAYLMLAVASLLYVFYLAGRLFVGMTTTRLGHLRERRDAIYEGLRDLNFEYIAGKVLDADYSSLNVLSRHPIGRDHRLGKN